ncbi:MAG: hypothetical protein R3263_09990 [Myxococcota bacterium]|nr:hypothetical protein [Myxococcota bacterium]
MSSDRTESAIIVLVLVASGSVLAAPVAGRAGAETVAHALAIVAAGSGLAAFGTAGVNMFRSARRAGRRPEGEE